MKTKPEQTGTMSRPPVRDERLDAWRGFALCMMVLHHFIYDLRYVFGLDVFAWQEGAFFVFVLRPIFLVIFLFVSGYASRYSRNPELRALKMTAAAGAASLLSLLLNAFIPVGVIYWNMLHTLAAGLWLHRFLPRQKDRVFALLILFFLTQLQTAFPLPPLPLPFDHMDYLPPLPWLLYFLLGVTAGQAAKAANESVPAPSRNLFIRFTARIGRRGLLVYALHQPLLLALLSLLQRLGLL